ncbi:unnamed protein product [Caenorhabditis sp. 36 PRJEB53466]|nr:unnamed protein product [Caenorhabditis sp. 36 PRJEB53466]
MLCLSDCQVAVLKWLLKNFGLVDPFPSLKKLQQFVKSVTSAQTYNIEIEQRSPEKATQSVRCQMKNVREALTERVKSLYYSNVLDRSTSPVKVTISGDKGAGSTKVALSFCEGTKTNSTDNCMIVALFTGNDNHADMRENLPEIINQLRNLKNVQFADENGTVVEKQIEYFLTGDFMFLSACFGHKGPKATNPCFQCMEDSRSLKNLKNWDVKKKSQSRTCQSYERYAETGEKGVRRGGVVLFPLVLLDHIIPPSLHINQGVFDKYLFRKLILLAMKWDSHTEVQRDLVSQLMDRDSAMNKLHEQLDYHKILFSIYVKDEDELRIIREIWRDKLTGDEKERSRDDCDARTCIQIELREKGHQRPPQLCICSSCHQTLHLECCGVLTSQLRILTEDEPNEAVCYDCKNAEVIPEIESLLKEVLAKKTETAVQIEQIEKSIAEIKASSPPEGRYRKALDGVIYGELKLVRKSYHGGSFTGNDIKTILQPENVAKILNVFPHNCDEAKELREMMHHMSRIMSLSVARELSDSEIDNLEENINNLVQKLKKAYPEDGVTPKLHLLAVHVVPFVRQFRTWGMTSEQAVEHLHSIIRKLELETLPIKDQSLRYTTIMRRSSVRTYFHDKCVRTYKNNTS